jgi:hypothetical protein
MESCQVQAAGVIGLRLSGNAGFPGAQEALKVLVAVSPLGLYIEVDMHELSLEALKLVS